MVVRSRIDTDAVERRAEATRQALRVERDIRARVARLHDRLLESRESLHFTPAALQNVIEVGLELAGQPQLVKPRASDDLTIFQMPTLSGTWARCTEGLDHPHTGVRRPVTFDSGLAADRDDVVLLHLSHRLPEMCQRLIRSQGVTPAGRDRLHRVSLRVLRDSSLSDPALIAHGRLVVQGGRGARLHEELISAGGLLVGGSLRRFRTIGELEDMWQGSDGSDAEPTLLQGLRDVWPEMSGALLRALEARRSERMRSLENTIALRRDADAEDIREVVAELGRTIEQALEEPDDVQLRFSVGDWTDPEREQLGRNQDALRLRLTTLPEEAEREIEAVHERYADPVSRVFPVSVSFLVPKSLVR